MKTRLAVIACFLAVSTTVGLSLVNHTLGEQTFGRAGVVSGSIESTQVGLQILARGGNAFDAAVAVSLALGLTEVHGSGIGGKMIAITYCARTKQTEAWEALDQAPRSLPVEEYLGLNKTQRTWGPKSAAIPGLVKGLYEMHRQYGQLPWSECLQPVIQLAEEGFPLSNIAAMVAEVDRQKFLKSPALFELMGMPEAVATPKNAHVQAGTIVRLPEAAHVLRQLAAEGADAFYRGKIADTIVAAVREAGGWFQKSDFERYEVRRSKPLHLRLENRDFYSAPAPLSGGGLLLMSLAGFHTSGEAPQALGTVAGISSFSSTMMKIYPAVAARFGDEAQSDQVSRAWLAQAQAWLTAQRQPAETAGLIEEEELETDTTHLVVIDEAGNIVNLTQSIGTRFGSGFVVPGTAILLNNSMANFSLSRSGTNLNFPRGGKRPRSTMAPLLVFEDNEPLLAIGSPSGQRIPTGIAQVTLGLLAEGLDPLTALRRPRFHPVAGSAREGRKGLIAVEEGFPKELIRSLQAEGWQTEVHSRAQFYFGGVNLARFTPDGEWIFAADFRRSNIAGTLPNVTVPSTAQAERNDAETLSPDMKKELGL